MIDNEHLPFLTHSTCLGYKYGSDEHVGSKDQSKATVCIMNILVRDYTDVIYYRSEDADFSKTRAMINGLFKGDTSLARYDPTIGTIMFNIEAIKLTGYLLAEAEGMILTKGLYEGLTRFVVYHELGHTKQNLSNYYSNKKQLEFEANCFAIEHINKHYKHLREVLCL